MPEYTVHVHVIECRDLVGKDSNGMSDPVVNVVVAGQKQSTAVHKRTTTCVWDHMMFFTFDMSEDEFEVGKVQLSVYDSNTIRRNELIGSYDVDFGYVYGQKQHEVYRRWVVLCDTIRFGYEIQGFLKISVAVLGPNDTPPSHGEEECDDEEDDENATNLADLVLKPPEMDLLKFELCIRAYRAEDLPKMDTFGKCDPYVLAKFAANKPSRTDIVKKTFFPTWNQEIRLPVYFPCLSDRIEVDVMDHDVGSDDDFIGSSFFRFTDVKLDEYGPCWVNLYGAPTMSLRDKLSRLMNSGREEPSAYKGRVLLALDVEHVDEPQLVVKGVSPCAEPPVDQYTLRFDLYQGAEFPPGRMQNVQVDVSIGPHKVKSRSVSTKNGQVSWLESLNEIVMSYPKDQEQIPDIIINVYLKGFASSSRIGYLKYSVDDVWGFANPARWVMLQADPLAAGYKKDMIAGFLLFSLDFGRTAECPKIRPPIERPKMMTYELRAHIYQARDLIAGDPNGTSDPYAVVRLGPKTAKTSRKDKTLYPIWYETLIFEVDLPQTLTYAPQISLQVFDWDRFDKDDFLGRCEIPCNKASKRFPGDPKWYPLYMDDPTKTQGEILCSFQLIPAAESRKISIPDITPKFKECVFEMSIVGLRKLLSPGFRNLRDIYLAFDMGEKKQVWKTRSSDKPDPYNPNILEIVNIPCSLPLNALFAPSINVRVYDKRLTGDERIGAATIPIGPFLPWSNEEVHDDGLPKKVDKIPGSDDQEEVQEQEIDILPEEEVEIDPIPEDLVDSNVVIGAPLQFKSTGELARTIPDVADTMLGDKDDGDEKPDRPETENELELSLKEQPFVEYQLSRGIRKKKDTFFTRMWRKKSKRSAPSNGTTPVGLLKGRFRVYEKAMKDSVLTENPPLDLQKLFATGAYVVRFYILRGRHLVPKDSDGKSDPYIKIIAGKGKKQIVNARDEYIKKTLSPDFFKFYEVPVTFPGDSEVTVQVWDRDSLAINDDLIGETKVDLENRLYCDEWKEMNPKPREFRTLWHPLSTNPQGKLEMWIEILTQQMAMKTRPTPLAAPAPMKCELRLIVWSTKDVVFKDKNMSDIFVRCFAEWSGEKQQTDVHWRSKNGKGEFNWRMAFTLEIPCKVPRIKLQVWDKDMLNPNDAIAECNLNLKGLFSRVYKAKSGFELDKQWLKMTHPNFEGTQGKLQCTLQILTESESKSKPAGLGRDEPNQYPELDVPNRPKDSYPPWRMDKKLANFLWAQRWKIAAGTVLTAIGYAIVYFTFGPGANNNNNGNQ